MLQERFLSVMSVRDRDELLGAVVGFMGSLGFDTVSVTAVVDAEDGEAKFYSVDNTPQAYRATFESLQVSRRDPVAQHCKHRSDPIVWDQTTYTAAGRGEQWEHQARFGYRTGIALAMHLPACRHLFIGVDRDQPLPRAQAELTRMAAELSLFAAHAEDAVLRVLAPKPEPATVRSLTARELEALRWTMEGKTAWEVGRILGISEQTTVRHLFNASRKLDCVNKHQAVVKALRLRLIA